MSKILEEKWNQAYNLSVSGPLHLAEVELRDLLGHSEYRGKAVEMLAGIYRRRGKLEKAAQVLASALRDGVTVPDRTWLEQQLLHVQNVRSDLKELDRRRFDRDGLLQCAVLPDGSGGHQVGMLGFPGVWRLSDYSREQLSAAAVLRICRTLYTVVSSTNPGEEWSGEITVSETLSTRVIVDTANQRVEATLAGDAWRMPPIELACHLKECLFEANIPNLSSFNQTPPEGKTDTVLLLSPGEATDYGVELLAESFRSLGWTAMPVRLPPSQYYEEALGKIKASLNQQPCLVTISVIDTNFPQVSALIPLVRTIFPYCRVAVGGPSTQTPEQMAARLPDFDLLIRGFADDILPILASLTLESEWPLLARGLPGGLVIREDRQWIINYLNRYFVPEKFFLPPPRERLAVHYLQASRGCPYYCRFCNKWSGRHYRLVSSTHNGGSAASSSSKAICRWLLNRLAMHTTAKERQGLIKKLLMREEKMLSIPDWNGPIQIVFQDDDFLANREHIRLLHKKIVRLGLGKYFRFAAIAAVPSLCRLGSPDVEMINWLREMNFNVLNLGTDGLTQKVLDENQKGSLLEKQVLPLNESLRQAGIYALNNVILTTPGTSRPEMIESLIMMGVWPFPLNNTVEAGILGHLGSGFTNEDLVGESLPVGKKEAGGPVHVVHPGFPEYAVKKSYMVPFADPAVMQMVVEMSAKRPWMEYLNELSQADVRSVLAEMAGRTRETSPEIISLAKIIIYRWQKGSLSKVLDELHEEMAALRISSFTLFLKKVEKKMLQRDSTLKSMRVDIARYSRMAAEEKISEAARGWEQMAKHLPLVATPLREAARIWLRQCSYRQALKCFYQLQELRPDPFFYQEFCHDLIRGLGLEAAFAQGMAAFFPAHYHRLNPIYYLLATAWEAAGSPPGGIRLPLDKFEWLRLAGEKCRKLTCEEIDSHLSAIIEKPPKKGEHFYLAGFVFRHDGTWIEVEEMVKENEVQPVKPIIKI